MTHIIVKTNENLFEPIKRKSERNIKKCLNIKSTVKNTKCYELIYLFIFLCTSWPHNFYKCTIIVPTK